MRELPVSEQVAAFVTAARRGVAAALAGSDDRLLVVVGPCSIHDSRQAIDYATRLRQQIDLHHEDLHICLLYTSDAADE